VKDAQGAGLNWIRKGNGGVVSFYFTQSWTSPVFSDMRFRKALNLAIDRDAINKQLCGGLAKPFGAWPASKILAVGGDPNKQKPYPYDLQEARRLIKEGGWEGHEFGLISYDRAGFPELPKVAEALAGYWQKIGLKPKIIVSEWGVWRRTRFEPKGQNMIYCTDDTINADVGALLIKYVERFCAPKSKISTVNIPEVNEKIDRMDKTMNISEISKLMIEVSRYSYDHYLMIPICETFDEIATTKRIPKWDPGLRRNDRNYYDLIKQR
jgi:ABC-type transport system substrate-binding protein